MLFFLVFPLDFGCFVLFGFFFEGGGGGGVLFNFVLFCLFFLSLLEEERVELNIPTKFSLYSTQPLSFCASDQGDCMA